MEKNEVIHVRVSSELKKALVEHARDYYGLSVGQVIRFLIASELGEEGKNVPPHWVHMNKLRKGK